MDEKVRQMEFNAGNNREKYKLGAIWDNAVYARESESGYLPSLYYLVSWRGYLEEENTWELASAVHYLRKLISSFYKDHPDKPNATSPAIDTPPPMARPTIKPTEPFKQKWGWSANSTNKRAKINGAAFDFYRVFGQSRVTLRLTSPAILYVTTHDYKWLHMTTHDYTWLHVTIRDFQPIFIRTSTFQLSSFMPDSTFLAF